MSLFNKIKEIFQSDSSINKTAGTAENQPSATKENYIENEQEALNIICSHLGRFSCSTDRNLAVLNLWVIINPKTDSQVYWADSNFQKELKVRLQQERIDAVKNIEVRSVTLAELNTIIAQDPLIKPMVNNRLYYKTHALSEKNELTIRQAAVAWLTCIGGQENVRDRIVKLNPESKKIWHIGRSEHPSVIDTNDIIINDDCKSISRQQAAIIIDDGNYYVKCKKGGCRALGGCVTKIIRSATGSHEELVSLSHRALQYLRDGDIIQLSRSVYLKFTYQEPEVMDKPAALQQVDDSF